MSGRKAVVGLCLCIDVRAKLEMIRLHYFDESTAELTWSIRLG
jgi:hypothetical protein